MDPGQVVEETLDVVEQINDLHDELESAEEEPDAEVVAAAEEHGLGGGGGEGEEVEEVVWSAGVNI